VWPAEECKNTEYSRCRFESTTDCSFSFLKIPYVTPHAMATFSHSLLVTSFRLMLVTSSVHRECIEWTSEINIFCHYCHTRLWHCLKLSVAAMDPLKLSDVTQKTEHVVTTKRCCSCIQQHCLCTDISMDTSILKHLFCLVLLLACLPVGYKDMYIEEKLNSKFLGLHLDDHLNWKVILIKWYLNLVQRVMQFGQCSTSAT
jgi:hypothetical protein